MKPVLTVNGFSYTYPQEISPALCNISLTLQAGGCLCLSGPSGCGKTTLLLAIQALLRKGRSNGSIDVDLRIDGSRSGLVFQNADSQILCTTVGDEVAFGPQNMGFEPHQITRNVQKALNDVGLDGFENRNVDQLSAGEKQRLTLAAVLSAQPSLLLLDEPSSQLDAAGKKRLLDILKRLKTRGISCLVADHDLQLYTTVADRFIFMNNGRITADKKKLPSEFGQPEQNADFEFFNRPKSSGMPVVRINGLELRRADDTPIFSQLDLEIFQGERVYIFGANGAGKSTLLRCMTGIVKPDSDNIEIAGISAPRPEKLIGRIGILFQNPERQLFENTVQDEIGFTLKRLGLPGSKIVDRVEESLNLCEAAHLSDQPPLSLSYGEQHRVALASVIAPQPAVLMLDEPLAGLDLQQRYRILAILSRLVKKHGTTVIMFSHNPIQNKQWADRQLILQEGRLEAFSTI